MGTVSQATFDFFSLLSMRKVYNSYVQKIVIFENSILQQKKEYLLDYKT